LYDVKAKVCYDRDTGNSRGFGFVSYDTEAALDKAIKEMDGKDFGGRYLAVKKAAPRAESKDGNHMHTLSMHTLSS
jgi:RNA recognition motif-containing protein